MLPGLLRGARHRAGISPERLQPIHFMQMDMATHGLSVLPAVPIMSTLPSFHKLAHTADIVRRATAALQANAHARPPASSKDFHAQAAARQSSRQSQRFRPLTTAIPAWSVATP